MKSAALIALLTLGLAPMATIAQQTSTSPGVQPPRGLATHGNKNKMRHHIRMRHIHGFRAARPDALGTGMHPKAQVPKKFGP
jgi:hypothetical protein